MNAQQLKLVAIQAGDALKNDTSVGEITRAGQSVFGFSKEVFPVEGISSARATEIYCWIMTLGKQKIDSDERARQLNSFLLLLTNDNTAPSIDKILEAANIGSKHTSHSREFTFRCFHKEINQHCKKLFTDGHYFHAVFEAAKVYNKLVREKSKSNKDGQSLMLEVWPPKGTLKITSCQTETDKNVQAGVGFLAAGLMQAIRNPTAHEPAQSWPISEQDCLELLSFISFLFRKLDEAVYHQPN